MVVMLIDSEELKAWCYEVIANVEECAYEYRKYSINLAKRFLKKIAELEEACQSNTIK